jgi:hypothetical protein
VESPTQSLSGVARITYTNYAIVPHPHCTKSFRRSIGVWKLHDAFNASERESKDMRATLSAGPASDTVILLLTDAKGSVIWSHEYDRKTTLSEVMEDVTFVKVMRYPLAVDVSLPSSKVIP